MRLGLSYASIGQYERALRALSGALNAFGASNDSSGRATCLQVCVCVCVCVCVFPRARAHMRVRV